MIAYSITDVGLLVGCSMILISELLIQDLNFGPSSDLMVMFDTIKVLGILISLSRACRTTQINFLVSCLIKAFSSPKRLVELVSICLFHLNWLLVYH